MADPGRDAERDDLQSAFESFRADALADLSPTGIDAVKAAARHRVRVHRAMGGVAAGLVALAALGATFAVTGTPPIGRQGITTAASQGARHPVATADSSHRATSQPHRSGGAGTGSPQPPASGSWGVAVQVPKRAVALAPSDSGDYTGQLVVTLNNTGAEAIPHTSVTLSAPVDVTFTADGTDTRCTAGDTCELAAVADLAPGDTYTVTGRLTYGQADPSPGTETDATVQAVATDSDGAPLTTDTQTITVSVGEASPSPSASPSGSPSPSASPAG